jgi:hypothetical protein
MEQVQFESLTRDDIFDRCYPNLNGIIPLDIHELFVQALSLLLEGELLIRSRNSDGDEIFTPTGREMDDINDYVDMSKDTIASLQLQKSILGSLTIQKSIFNSIILYCQYDKSNQQGFFIVNTIKTMLAQNLLPVILVVGDNLSSLMDQTIDGFHKLLCSEFGIDSDKYQGLMCLKSDEKISVQSIEHYIDSYHMDHLKQRSLKKPPPIIMALNNKVQLKKIIDIHRNKIVAALMEDPQSPLRSVFDIDEFDKVYRSLRPMFKPVLIDNPVGVYRVLGVTGSHDDICEDCPEWASSNLVRVEVNADKQKNYRGIHHPEAKIHRYKQPSSLSNNNYALNIIGSNLSSFKDAKVNPRNGTTYYPKTIILGDHRIVGQKALATKLLEWGFHVILQNENNLKVCLCTSDRWILWSIRKKVVRDELYKMFNDLNLWGAPVAIIGNKKLDRGLGYQYAHPVDVVKGLIWTNEIMGSIDGNANRIQKVSRLHGVIAQSEDYPNELNFWIDEKTELTVRNENEIIKCLHEDYAGFQTLEERLDYARKVTTLLTKTRKYMISETFATRDLAKEWFIQEKIRLNMSQSYECSVYGLYLKEATDESERVVEGTPGITKIRYRGQFMNIMTDKEIRVTNEDIGQGANSRARIMPVFVDDNIRFVVIYVKKDPTPTV